MFAAILLLVLLPLLAYLYVHSRFASQRAAILQSLSLPPSTKILAFFHPYCNAGGGGERVLWAAIAYIQRTRPGLLSVVYTGDVDATKSEILKKVESRFSITLAPETLHFVFLKRRVLIEDATYPHFTLIGQSMGSVGLVLEAMSLLVPHAYIDTMGYAFTLPVVRLFGVPVGAYVHYPTVSPPMISRVQSTPKLIYYHAFMLLYALALRRARVLMVNSTWTKKHVDAVLAYPGFGRWGIVRPLVVYPSCDNREMARLPLEGRERVVISIAQFRPEKDHAKQIRALHELLAEHPEHAEQGIKLVLIGGCRNAADEARVEVLRALARELSVDKYVQFELNAPYPDMLAWLRRASVGLNTMLDEHFGINVVEFMAAGVIPIAHASGGPLEDIVVPFQGEITGYHAITATEFASQIHAALTLSSEEDLAIRQRARAWAVQRFSEAEFEAAWEGSGWSKLVG
ncbi:mannosyltransferase [Roridomyces roridus]|uniref:GDP-Man:Man(3)GlcNAc(2)-PP-Dol alpha-1,2-mannosyltransferase n=1 Tax=Roridomyces roridus TaxID=1738132 RepID=A0AAD7BX18_9AGAR|nr:mannosyltransferase [Roridomyces roridus]